MGTDEDIGPYNDFFDCPKKSRQTSVLPQHQVPEGPVHLFLMACGV